MEILLLGIIPWIFGIIYIVQLINKSNGKISDFDLVKALRERLNLAKTIEDQKKMIDVINLYSLNKINFQVPTQIIPNQEFHTTNSISADVGLNNPVTGIKPTNPQSYIPSPPPVHKSISDSLENINILLYLGSFLIVVAAAIFVGFNYQLLSGSSKIIFMLAFSLIFYFSGLGLYCFTSKLKPAGLTFNTIGMIIFPLVGVAFWRFVAMGDHDKEVWFVTSLITLLLYLASVLTIKKTFIAYFLTFTALSLFESSISMFSFPLYYLLWGMAIFSLIVNYTSRKINPGYGVKESLDYTSQFVLPVSFFCSIIAISWLGLMQAGVNALIAFAFYLIYSFTEENKNNKYLAFVGCITFLYLGVSMLAYNAKNHIEIIGLVLITISFISSAISIIINKFYTRNFQADILAVYSTIGSLMAGAFAFENHAFFLFIAVIALAINVANMLTRKNFTSLSFAIISLIQIPAIYFGLISDKVSDNYMLVASYILIGVLLQVLKTALINYEKKYKDIFLGGFYLSFSIALMTALNGGIQSVIFSTLIFIGFFFFLLSFYEYMTTYCGIGLVFSLMALFSFKSLIGLNPAVFALLITGFGLVIYYLHSLYNDDRKLVMQTAAIVYTMSATVYAFGTCGLDIVPIIVFYIFGALVYYLGYERNEKSIKYFAAALLIGATEVLMAYLKIEELHLYMLPWSFYFGTLGYLEYKEGNSSNRDLLVGIALSFQTLPLFLQTQGDNKQFYGLILGLESIVIIISGMLIKYNLLKYWGSTALMIIVLFQLKDELLALPKWLIIGVIGLMFLFGASYMLYKRQDHEITD